MSVGAVTVATRRSVKPLASELTGAMLSPDVLAAADGRVSSDSAIAATTTIQMRFGFTVSCDMGTRVRAGRGLMPLPVAARRGDAVAMADVLIIYGTSEVHTAVVVDHLRRPLEAVGDAPTCPIGYDLVLVGSSIQQGHHDRGVTRWLKGNAEFLGRVPSAFFQVSLSSAENPAGTVAAEGYVADLIHTTGWHPDAVGLFGGACEDVEPFAKKVASLLDHAPHAALA
jgi:menaquinone-dependent protoporphyrinogen IX oxidase